MTWLSFSAFALTYFRWFAPVGLTAVLVWIMIRNWRAGQPSRSIGAGLVLVAAVQIFVTLIFGLLVWYRVLHGAYPQAYLPPHGTYFFDQLARNVTPLLAGWVISGAVMALLLYVFVKRGGSLMLDQHDVLLITIGAAATGWPGVFIFLATLFALAVIGMIVLVIFRKKSIQDRLIVTPYVLPAAILTVLFGSYPAAWTHLDKIRF